ncbi:hypothetical protein [Streptomyces katsurahamanus]|uniref:Uncharacterized protein n=3 Tax=Streptomyces TaxID=1883 RepID=A0A646KG86_STRJU|nr:hypothetical protein [Streptomyces katsurahamanus]MQS37599.1 hypothetical protein [Streptomyces katsurahamanus]MQT01265.1 hypothetical protein [Streptomyces jumonjinensis]
MRPARLVDEIGDPAERRTDPDPRENDMFQYRLQELRSAELIERAETRRLARQARRARRAAKHPAQDGEGRVSGLRERFARAA